MNFTEELRLAISSYSEAYVLVKKNKLVGLLFFSCLLYLLLIGLSAWMIWIGIDKAVESLLTWSWIKNFTTWITDYPFILTLTKVGIYISSFFLFVSLYKYLFLAMASPLYAYISERTAEIIQDTKYPFDLAQFISDVGRGILISLKNFINQLFITLIFFFLSFIPLLGWFFSIGIILTDCYYYGFSMLDYNCEREKMSVRESRSYIRKHKGLAIGNGLIMYLSFMIPIVGIVLLAPLSAVAAGISYHKIKIKS